MSAAREEQTRRAGDARGAELHGPRLVTLRVVNVGVGNDEREPQLSQRIDGGGTNNRLNERNLAILDLSRRPRRGLRRDEVVDLPSLDVPLVQEVPARVVLAEHRGPR